LAKSSAEELEHHWQRGPEREGPQSGPCAVGFEPASGDLLVYGMAAFGIALLIIGLGSGRSLLAMAAMGPLALSFWNYPLIDKSAPQLATRADGLFVERLGLIPWAEIADLELKQTAVRNMLLARLVVTLHRPFADIALRPHHTASWKRWMMRNWSLHKSKDDADRVVIDLHPLTGTPQTLLEKARSFLPRSKR